jgi:4'-phosphopantetheinyl transferase
MPLIIFQHILEERGKLMVWHATESTAELRERFSRNFPDRTIPVIKLEKREREYIIGRLLLHLVLPDQEMTFLDNGKPVLEGRWHMSLSHSAELVALAIADVPVGLDLQAPDPKLLRIAPKYCSHKEMEWLGALDHPLEGALVIWSAKEAVFKIFGQGIEFAEDMDTRLHIPSQSNFHVQYKGTHGNHLFEMVQLNVRDAQLIYTALLD